MSIITISTPFNIDLEFKIAAFGKRVFAWLIDMVFICLYFYLMVSFIYPLFNINAALGVTFAYILLLIPVLLYQLLFELMLNGQTLGKKITGIKIIDKEGKEPTWGQYFIRWILCLGNLVVYFIPAIIISSPFLIFSLMILYLPDVITIAASANSQRIGDLAAGTVVIDSRYYPNIYETIFLKIKEDNYKPLFPQVMRLTDRDINGIHNLLNIKNPNKDTHIYTAQIVQKIKQVLGIESNMNSYEFLQQLMQDYNFLTRK